MFKIQSYDNILSRMLSRIPNKFDKREGSVLWYAVAPSAMELAQMYVEFQKIITEAFADTASYEYLIRIAKERGITPFEATSAVVKLKFNVEVPIGSRFGKNDLTYIVTEHIEGNYYKGECEQRGTRGNQYFGEIVPFEYIEGLEVSEVIELIIPARDLEDVEDFRLRYFDSFKAQAFGGNIKDYEEKTKGLNGVGAVRVTPVWNGGGTVKLTILDSQLNKASEDLISHVQTEIDPEVNQGKGVGLAPIGHIVTVDTVEEVNVIIETKITYDDGFSWGNLSHDIKSSIENYIKELNSKWETSNITVRLSQVESRILNVDGVIDVENTNINGKPENLLLSDYEIAKFGDIIETS